MLKRPAVIVSFGVLALLAGYVLAFPPQKIAGTHLAECPMSLGGLPGTALANSSVSRPTKRRTQ